MAPITVSRSTGKIISAPVLTQEQRDKLWEQVVKCHAQRHPELFQDQHEDEEGSA